ncbi:MAG TPA: hypothetical protein PLH19_10745 [Anaerolineae bacterium]|nr:hypothetical protein [Anaerolineae bacterium]HQH38995.1 hypothetical protein [Anaerolineae bacterium]
MGQGILPQEQIQLEQLIQAALLPALPTDRFVDALEHELIQEAQQQERRAQNTGRGWRIVGFVGGGLLSVAGAILMWMLWQRHRTPQEGGEAAATSKRPSRFRMPKIAKVTPAV